MRHALPTLLPLLIAGCASPADWAKQPLPVSVSAANYSEVSGEQLYMRVNGAVNSRPAPPAAPEPAKPLFYAFVPGEIYPSDVPPETVFRELAVPLAQRGYFNVVYQIKAGLLPNRIDYLLRIHCGERQWRTPTVRTDEVTWGDDGLVSSWHGARNPGSAFLIGPGAAEDSRSGMSPSELANLALFFQENQQGGNYPTFSEQQSVGFQDLSGEAVSRDFCLIMVEAFRFGDVMKMKKNAPCVWATFIAVPLHPGQGFSGVLRTMAHTAAPYFGTTTDGIQLYEVPPGKVLMGEPVEVPGPQKAP
jgi:hypothetical protein